MRLIITRHGETLENQQGIMQGHIPGILSKEGIIQAQKLAKKFLDEVLHQHKKETVLFVGHNGINKALIAVITNKTSADLPHIENHKNTSVNIYEIDEDRKHKIILFNCIKHLE